MRGRDDKKKRNVERTTAQRSGPQPQALAARLLALLTGGQKQAPKGGQRDR